MNRYRDTYRAPRSMLEARPGDYPGSVTHYRQPRAQRIASALLASAIGAGLALVLFYSLSA